MQSREVRMSCSIGLKQAGLVALVCAAVLASDAGCASTRDGQRTAGATSQLEPIGYPHGPWWRGDINRTLLGAAHILIAHEGAKSVASMLHVSGVPATRTRDQARALAVQLRDQLRATPERFAELAERYSDDSGTAGLQGVIGAVFAPNLPGEFVDALGNLKPGEVSRVVETVLGFHIIRRLTVDRPQVMAASTIVIGHDRSETIVRPDRPIRRTRTEALELAKRVRAQLDSDPSAFEQLARTYSDSFEADSGGNYGVWSTEQRDADSTVVYVLSRMVPGQISDVLETAVGFRILRRDPIKERASYAMTPLFVGYDHPGTRLPLRSLEAATRIASDISKELHADPRRFDRLRAMHCDYDYCPPPMDVSANVAGLVPIAEKLAALRIGEVTPDPVPSALGLVFARREESSGAAPGTKESVVFELPKPAPLSLETATADQLVWYMGQLREAASALKLDRERQKRLDEIFDNLTLSYKTVAPSARARVAADAGSELLAALGQDSAAKLGQLNDTLLRGLSGETVRND